MTKLEFISFCVKTNIIPSLVSLNEIKNDLNYRFPNAKQLIYEDFEDMLVLISEQAFKERYQDRMRMLLIHIKDMCKLHYKTTLNFKNSISPEVSLDIENLSQPNGIQHIQGKFNTSRNYGKNYNNTKVRSMDIINLELDEFKETEQEKMNSNIDKKLKMSDLKSKDQKVIEISPRYSTAASHKKLISYSSQNSPLPCQKRQCQNTNELKSKIQEQNKRAKIQTSQMFIQKNHSNNVSPREANQLISKGLKKKNKSHQNSYKKLPQNPNVNPIIFQNKQSVLRNIYVKQQLKDLTPKLLQVQKERKQIQKTKVKPNNPGKKLNISFQSSFNKSPPQIQIHLSKFNFNQNQNLSQIEEASKISSQKEIQDENSLGVKLQNYEDLAHQIQ